MGMFDKTQFRNFGETFTVGDRFVIVGAEDGGSIKTTHGEANRGIYTIVSRAHPTEKVKYQALGDALREQAAKSEPGDFPCVVELVAIPTGKGDNKIKRLVPVDVSPRAFIDGEDGPAVSVEQVIGAGDAEGIDPATALGF